MPDYHARVPTPIRQPRQPLKVLMFEGRKCPAGWPAGVRPDITPKPDHLKNRNAEPEEEDIFIQSLPQQQVQK